MTDTGMEHIKVESAELSSGVWELKIEGSLDWSNFAKVETAIEEIFKKGCYKVVVNLKGTKYISSAGFGCLAASPAARPLSTLSSSRSIANGLRM